MRIAGLTERIVRDMNEATERACEVLAATVDNWTTRCVRVHQDTGNAWGDVRRLEVDGVPVWRLWWEAGEPYVFTLRSEWLVNPGTLR